MSRKLNFVQILVLSLVIVGLSSCQKHKREIERMNSQKDSIEQVVGERDSAILNYISSFNQIQSKLDSVKQIQKILDVNLNNDGTEFKKDQKDQIVDDIAQINNLLNENKKMIAALRSKLKNSDTRIAELEVMLSNMARQIEEKDGEIAALNQQLEKMKIDINQLNNKIGELAKESENKTQTIESQISEMNTAYYCWGTKDELIKNNVIEKDGGFIGIGKSYKMKDSFNKDYFVKVDIREFSDILLMVKKAELITTHTEGSFRFIEGEKLIERFTIDDPKEFWGASKYMVILVETK